MFIKEGTREEMLEKYGRTYATVNLDNIHSNMDHMKANIDKDTKIIGVIKTDGYGHGAIPIAKELESLDYMYGFAVASIEEAYILRKSQVKKPILILGYTFPYCYEEMIRQEIRPAVFRYDMVKQMAECAASIRNTTGKDIRVKVHVKVDTGMSRVGIMPDEEGLQFIKQILATPEIELEGIFTHFARADEEDKSHALKQIHIFRDFIDKVEAQTGYKIPICHCSNSAGIVELKEANMNVVRAGITLYGLWPSSEVKKNIIDLKPALEWKSCVVFVKEVKAGIPISYGGTFVTKRLSRIATIPVGYGDGYPRGLSNKGWVLVCGKKAPIIGRVCMDQFMIDVTDIPEAAQGDEVTLIGKDGEACITMEELGELSGRFNYELACCIGKRVPRIYLKSGKIVHTKDYFSDFE